MNNKAMTYSQQTSDLEVHHIDVPENAVYNSLTAGRFKSFTIKRHYK